MRYTRVKSNRYNSKVYRYGGDTAPIQGDTVGRGEKGTNERDPIQKVLLATGVKMQPSQAFTRERVANILTAVSARPSS